MASTIVESVAVSVQDILDAPPRQRNLSSKIEDHQLRMLFDLASSPAQCARLLSVSSPHSSAWLHTPQLNLHLEPPEFQVALKWWLGMDTSQNACCAFYVMKHHCVNEEDDDDIKSGSTSSLNSDTDSNDFLVPEYENRGPDPDDFTALNLFYGRGGVVLAMGAMRVVVAAARVAAGKVVVGALVPILVTVVGLVQVAAVLLLLLLEVGAALLLAVGQRWGQLCSAGAVLQLLLAADSRGAAMYLAAVAV
ncbi:hypothetical protein EMCRGX_G018157 [Ephydatia muelleri]